MLSVLRTSNANKIITKETGFLTTSQSQNEVITSCNKFFREEHFFREKYTSLTMRLITPS